MIELNGKYNNAKIYTDNVDSASLSQILEICNKEEYKDSKIRMMPDVHAGAGCTIGTTMAIKDKVCPGYVGYDIGCGMITVTLGNINIDFEKLDLYIKNNIPHGMTVFDTIGKSKEAYVYENILSKLKCLNNISVDRTIKSVGTLGGGNHFIEISEDDKCNKYLIVHTGSRYLGKQVATYYQELAYKRLCDNRDAKTKLINKLTNEGRQKDIQSELKKISPTIKVSKESAYLCGKDFDDYIHDMKLVQNYAEINRTEIAISIIGWLKDNVNKNIPSDSFQTVHNYIDTDNMILRKGAISAQKDELILIPLNMRDGSILAKGKGNSDWNYSAPHGAGRVLSRSKAKEVVDFNEFKDSMKNVWSTSVCESTIDESPMAYKPIEDIIDNVNDTLEVIDILKPIYNFKSH